MTTEFQHPEKIYSFRHQSSDQQTPPSREPPPNLRPDGTRKPIKRKKDGETPGPMVPERTAIPRIPQSLWEKPLKERKDIDN